MSGPMKTDSRAKRSRLKIEKKIIMLMLFTVFKFAIVVKIVFKIDKTVPDKGKVRNCFYSAEIANWN